MQINGVHEQVGTALLLAAAPMGKGKLTEASSVVPALAAVPPAALVGTAAATLIELVDPVDPQAVLTRIRGAAASSGPLTVVLVGQIQLDRRQRSVHLALARTTPTTMRYTALPWAWLISELQQRRPGTTTLYVDLAADPEAWQLLDEEPLPLPGGAQTYGVIAPPPGRRRIAHPTYIHALAQILRTGQRFTPDQLHHQILRHDVAAEDALVLGPEPSEPAVRTALPSSSTAHAAPAPGPTAAPPSQRQAQVAPVPGQVTSSPLASAPPLHFPPPVQAPRLPAQVTPPASPTPAAAPVQPSLPPPRTQRTVSPIYVPSNAVVPVEPDPHERIVALSRAGRHHEAAAMATAAEQRAVEQFGADTFAAVHWVEVRAHLASVARNPGLSCQLWLQAAQTRLDTLQQAPDAPDVESAVDRAHHQWDRVQDAERARFLAVQLIALRRRVPGRQRAALRVLQTKLERLNSLPRS